MKELKQVLIFFIFMTILTGFAYPLFITAIAQITMPGLANGSLIHKENKLIGSALIAQNMREERYFWARPSAIDYDPIKPSGGSNLGPTSKKLKEAVEERKQKIGDKAPPELLYASGSGLDPHISLETAYFQIPRVAKARSMDEGDLKHLVDSLSEGKKLGFLRGRYVNVLTLNLALGAHDRKRR